ncbi:MAG: hypothetical protein AMXMBFR12_01660 [Candidatus Babeliales bacterium]
MELQNKEMVEIKGEEDLRPFFGKIVAFMLNDSQNALTTCYASDILGNTQLKFGLVYEAYYGMKFRGYQLIQIVKTKTKSFWDIIEVENIQKGLTMREAYEEELVALHESTSTKKDSFVIYSEPEKGLRIIENQSGFEFKREKLA